MQRTQVLVGISTLVFILLVSGCGNTSIQNVPPLGSTIVKSVGETESSFLIQKINADSVEGLWYQAYPVARGEGIPKTLQIGDDIGYACEGISEKLTRIDFSGQQVTFTKMVGQQPVGGCPICLSGETYIDTPYGNTNVQELKKGTSVWTVDGLGHKQLATVVKVGRTPVPLTHTMVHLVLDDGRALSASRGHPMTNGKTIGEIQVDDMVGDSGVKRVELVPYDQKYTYDILPSGDTGFYWANGILVGSTLK